MIEYKDKLTIVDDATTSINSTPDTDMLIVNKTKFQNLLNEVSKVVDNDFNWEVGNYPNTENLRQLLEEFKATFGED